MSEPLQARIPVLLLKTRSTPTDAYAELFSALDDHYTPVFVPVLEHRFDRAVLDNLREQILNAQFAPSEDASRTTYGALIFTSQRAVEAFALVVDELRKTRGCSVDELLPESLPLYVVGPATARGLRALNLRCAVLGEETGNGEALAAYILDHYNKSYRHAKPRVLFLVGDKRRDVIPRTLQSEQLERERRVVVDEVVVYQTVEMHSFNEDFSTIWRRHADEGLTRQWVVVFSPSGCQAMLKSLGLLDAETGKAKSPASLRNVLVATIGPTTRSFLEDEFGLTPDVCAEKPSPEGVAAAIRAYMESH